VTGAIAELLERCRAADLSLTVEGDALHVDFDRNRPPTDLIKEIRQNKLEVMAALRPAATVNNFSDRSATVVCIVCRRDITGNLSHWWGGKPCHRACGESAFQEAKSRGDYQVR
jgi:hypothetical protein